MMDNQCESCKKLVKKADIAGNVCPKCGQAFRIENQNEIKEEIAIDVNENKVVEVTGNEETQGAAPAEQTVTETPVVNKHEIPAELEGVIVAGKKGVTNFQMIPAMKTAIDANDVEKLQLLKQHFGPVFESTTKYVGKERKNKLIALELAV